MKAPVTSFLSLSLVRRPRREAVREGSCIAAITEYMKAACITLAAAEQWIGETCLLRCPSRGTDSIPPLPRPFARLTHSDNCRWE
ncbi:hypothetical protein E2C01_035556 [Portunus trituberculatus]|uniref:Uncharacterized protein n=1 Tax=Portunus trituberculatus TaxID=210409 RepID=A0A5B7F8N4_PORTR|nr:hypothetical protein [Portunus trituberculatus]